MESLSEYYNAKLKLVRDLNELARDTPEELESVLLEVNNEKHMMREQIAKMKQEVSEWKLQLDRTRKYGTFSSCFLF